MRRHDDLRTFRSAGEVLRERGQSGRVDVVLWLLDSDQSSVGAVALRSMQRGHERQRPQGSAGCARLVDPELEPRFVLHEVDATVGLRFAKLDRVGDAEDRSRGFENALVSLRLGIVNGAEPGRKILPVGSQRARIFRGSAQ